MKNEKVLKAIAVKEARMDDVGSLKAWPSVTGVLDLYNDVIFPGAFKDCLPTFLTRGFIPTDHSWTTSAIVAYPTLAEERGNKLYSECRFHTTDYAQQMRLICQERIAAGLEVGLSIGFSMEPGDYVYFANGKELLAHARKSGCDMKLFDVKAIERCTEQCTAITRIAELWEYSLTPVPANQQAQAIAVKSGARLGLSRGSSNINMKIDMKLKAICGSLKYDLASKDIKWNATDAIKRIKEHTGATEEPNAEFAKAFVVVDGETDDFTAYKLPFADVVDGTVVAVPKAIQGIAGVLDGARGGVELSDADRDGAKRFVEKYYAKMAKEFGEDISVPWADAENGTHKRYKGMYLGNHVEHDMCLSAMYEAYYSLMWCCSDIITKSGDYAGMGDQDLYDCMNGAFDEHKDLCMAMFKAIMNGSGAQSAEDLQKNLRDGAAKMIGCLGDGLPYATRARLTVDAAKAFKDQTTERIEMRRKNNRQLSAENRQMLSEQLNEMQTCVELLKTLIAESVPVNEAKTSRLNSLRRQFLQTITEVTAA